MIKSFILSAAITVSILTSGCVAETSNIQTATPTVNVSTKDYVHPRSRYVDYGTTYAFPSAPWRRVDIDAYRSTLVSVYGRPSNVNINALIQKCDSQFHNYSLLKNVNVGDYGIENHPKTVEQFNCVMNLREQLHNDVVLHGRNSQLLNYFYTNLIPAWTSNDAFNASGMKSTQIDNTDAAYAFLIDTIARLYTSYGHYWGTSQEMDQGFKEWWDRRSYDDKVKIYSGGWEKCTEISVGPPPPTSPRPQSRGECQNVAADYASALAYMALYYKDSDMLNEAIFVAGKVAKTSSAEGAPHDAFTGYLAIGYMQMTASALDETAMVLQDAGINLYEMSFANHGATVRDIIVFSGREYMNPTEVFKYSCPTNNPNARDCHDIDWSVPFKDRVWAASTNMRSMSGALYQYPEFRSVMATVNPGGHRNEIHAQDFVFNKYILAKYF